MRLNLNTFLLGTSTALDMAENELLEISAHHSKRCAYMSLRIAKALGLNKEECFDICSLAFLHDNGIIHAAYKQNALDLTRYEKKLQLFEKLNDHCVIGEKNIVGFPFLTSPRDVILYHHEYIDGSGPFGLKGDDIPIMSQIISFVDDIDMNFGLNSIDQTSIELIQEFVLKGYGKWYNQDIVDTFLNLSTSTLFWKHLKDSEVIEAIKFYLPKLEKEISLDELLHVSSMFSNIIDSKSTYTAKHSLELMYKAKAIAKHLNWDRHKSISFQVAANLHDIEKLMVPNKLLEKSDSLTKNEYNKVKLHVEATYNILDQIQGLECIARWASLHHERIDGSGYPFGYTGEKLCYESQLLAALDMYQALTENRPYRKSFNHDKAIGILYDEVSKGRFNKDIIKTIENVFLK